MSRRPDPQLIDAARGAALWSRLTVSGIPEERADAWIDAWDAYATRAFPGTRGTGKPAGRGSLRSVRRAGGPHRSSRRASTMAERVVLIGCGGIGSQLLDPLCRYLAHRPEPRPLLVLVDGDTFEAGNLNRQACTPRDLGTNKAEALARVARDAGVACQAIGEHVDGTNVRQIVREGDVVLLAVDNHRTRALIDRHVVSLDNATLISGGNDETDGNVQLVRRRDGWSLDGHLTEIHPEIGEAADGEERAEPGCQVLAAERPQLLVTNLMVASAMLNALWQVVESGSVPYSEVFLDVIQNVARPRRWFRLRPGEQ